jgi:hypothetical protein
MGILCIVNTKMGKLSLICEENVRKNVQVHLLPFTALHTGYVIFRYEVLYFLQVIQIKNISVPNSSYLCWCNTSHRGYSACACVLTLLH